MAANKWSFMCFECVELVIKKVEIPGCFYGLKDVLAAIQLPGLTDVLAKPVAATAPVKEELPAFDDTTPHCSMALTDLAQPDDDTHNLMRVAQEHDVEQFAKATECAGKYVHLL